MKVERIPIDRLTEAVWTPNTMDRATMEKLKNSLLTFGQVENLVVRRVGEGIYEVLSGNHRLGVLRELGHEAVPCVVVDLDDARARLLAQLLNRLHGEDDVGLRAEVVRDILDSMPQAEVLSLLPETSESLHALASLGTADVAEQLQAWQAAQAARLRHMTFQLTDRELHVIQEALGRAMATGKSNPDNPNKKGTALAAICLSYLQSQGDIL